MSSTSHSKINDFVVRFANVNGTGSAGANFLFTKSVFRMRNPVTPKNCSYAWRQTDFSFFGEFFDAKLCSEQEPASCHICTLKR